MRVRARPLVIAHRGASGHRPENTRAAYELALRLRADMIEIDLHRTADGAIVVAHDETLDGLGGAGAIADATLGAVQALDAGEGERVPILEDVLDCFGAAIPFNLEFKRGPAGPYPGLERDALAAVEARGLLSETLFSSFDDPVLARLRALSPAARIGLLVSARSAERAIERARALGAEAIHPWFGLVGGALVATAHDAGLAVHPYTVDDVADMRRLLDLGVDGLFTNYPERLRALVDSPAGPSSGDRMKMG